MSTPLPFEYKVIITSLVYAVGFAFTHQWFVERRKRSPRARIIYSIIWPICWSYWIFGSIYIGFYAVYCNLIHNQTFKERRTIVLSNKTRKLWRKDE